MDPPSFMLAPLSMIDDEYQTWSVGIVSTDRLLEDGDYDEFSESHFMPPFGVVVCNLIHSLFFFFLSCMSYPLC